MPSPPASDAAAAPASRLPRRRLPPRAGPQSPLFAPRVRGRGAGLPNAGRASQIASFTCSICPVSDLNRSHSATSRSAFSSSGPGRRCVVTVLPPAHLVQVVLRPVTRLTGPRAPAVRLPALAAHRAQRALAEVTDPAEVGIQPGPLCFQARQIRLVRHPRLPGYLSKNLTQASPARRHDQRPLYSCLTPGRVAGGSTGPGSPSLIAGTVWAGQGACGSASMSRQAVVIASAHGQVAWIFRCRFRPPRTSRAAACRTRPVN